MSCFAQHAADVSVEVAQRRRAVDGVDLEQGDGTVVVLDEDHEVEDADRSPVHELGQAGPKPASDSTFGTATMKYSTRSVATLSVRCGACVLPSRIAHGLLQRLLVSRL